MATFHRCQGQNPPGWWSRVHAQLGVQSWFWCLALTLCPSARRRTFPPWLCMECGMINHSEFKDSMELPSQEAPCCASAWVAAIGRPSSWCIPEKALPPAYWMREKTGREWFLFRQCTNIADAGEGTSMLSCSVPLTVNLSCTRALPRISLKLVQETWQSVPFGFCLWYPPHPHSIMTCDLKWAGADINKAQLQSRQLAVDSRYVWPQNNPRFALLGSPTPPGISIQRSPVFEIRPCHFCCARLFLFSLQIPFLV